MAIDFVPGYLPRLSAAFTGSPAPPHPRSAKSRHHPPSRHLAGRTLRRGQGHARYPQAHRLLSWLPGESALRRALAMVMTFDELDCLLDHSDGTLPRSRTPRLAPGANRVPPPRWPASRRLANRPRRLPSAEGADAMGGQVAESRPVGNRVWTDKSILMGLLHCAAPTRGRCCAKVRVRTRESQSAT